MPRALQNRSLRRRRRVHCRQLSGLRLPEAERLRCSRLEPRLQDDRSWARSGEGRRGRALEPALPVPVRAFRDRRSSSGLPFAVSLVLIRAKATLSRGVWVRRFAPNAHGRSPCALLGVSCQRLNWSTGGGAAGVAARVSPASSWPGYAWSTLRPAVEL